MKILIVHNKYQTTNIGGEDIVYKNELELLQKELGKESVFFYEVSNDFIDKFKLLFGIWFSFSHYKNIKKMVLENQIGIVHVHNFFPLLTPSVFKVAKNTNVKTIHTLHNYRLWCISGIFYRDGFGICEQCTKNRFSLDGILHKCYRKSLPQSFVAQLAFWFYRLVGAFESIDYFFVLTKFQKKKLISLGFDGKKLILKPNSVNMDFKIQENKSGYIYVGRLEESKGVLGLLKTWKELDDRFVLTIIGDGDIGEKLKDEYAANNIIFKGKCTRDETLRSISDSKYLIQPSLLYETFGLTIIEAMGFGVPVIGFDIGTRADFIQDRVNGFLSNSNNLKEVIEKSFHYTEYDSLSKNAIKTAKLYENKYIIEKQIEIYKDILESKV